LPLGFVLNASTCAISGAPRGALATTNYTVNATGAGGTQQIALSIAATLVNETLQGVFATSFGSSGLLTPSLTGVTPEDVTKGVNGKFDAVANLSGNTINVLQFESTGTLDTTFGSAGVATIDCATVLGNAACMPYDVRVQADGKVLVVSVAGSNYPTDNFVVLRLNSDGSVDTSYGTNGVTAISYTGGVDPTFVRAVLDSAGNLVLAGENALMVSGVQQFYPAMARLLPSGALDSTFGSQGQLSIMASAPNTGNARNIVRALAYDLYSNSFYLANANGTLGGVLVRVTANGVMDTTFGSDGSGFVATGVQDYIADSVGLAVQYADGKLVIAAGTKMQRYTPTGLLDTSFGTAGTVALSGFPSQTQLFVEPSENIVVAQGQTIFGAPAPPFFLPTFTSTLSIARYSSNGAADLTFGASGTFATTSANGNLSLVMSTFLDNGNLLLLSDVGNQLNFVEMQ